MKKFLFLFVAIPQFAFSISDDLYLTIRQAWENFEAGDKEFAIMILSNRILEEEENPIDLIHLLLSRASFYRENNQEKLAEHDEIRVSKLLISNEQCLEEFLTFYD